MKMIPSYIEENSPPGERVVFSRLQNETRGWSVIHSLDLAPYNNNRRTEIDFVILIPEYGILCVEVKSQKNIFFDGSRWMPKSIKSSPFKQALDGRYSFRRRLIDRFPKYRHIPVLHCCIFPFSDFPLEHNPNIKSFDVMDRHSFESCKKEDDFCQALINMFIRSIDSDPQVSRLTSPVTSEVIDEIINLCYPIRKRKPEKNERQNHSRHQESHHVGYSDTESTVLA